MATVGNKPIFHPLLLTFFVFYTVLRRPCSGTHGSVMMLVGRRLCRTRGWHRRRRPHLSVRPPPEFVGCLTGRGTSPSEFEMGMGPVGIQEMQALLVLLGGLWSAAVSCTLHSTNTLGILGRGLLQLASHKEPISCVLLLHCSLRILIFPLGRKFC